MTLLATAGLAGDSGPFPAPVQSRSAPPRSGIELVDEPLGSSDQPEFEPAGAGTQASTSQTTFQTLLEFEPDRDQTYMLEEIAVSIESNGQAQVGVNGVV